MPELSDAEVICGLMEPKPEAEFRYTSLEPTWWGWDFYIRKWKPRLLNLDALREVEQKLIDMAYSRQVRVEYEMWAMVTWHLTAAQKIEALAKVIRGLEC